MQYYWHVITSREGWETLTKQDVNYPTSFPVLAGCVQLSDTEFVVCPLPLADVPNLLAMMKLPGDDVEVLEAKIQANIAANADVTLQLPDDTK